jgi:hypothetical protein
VILFGFLLMLTGYLSLVVMPVLSVVLGARWVMRLRGADRHLSLGAVEFFALAVAASPTVLLAILVTEDRDYVIPMGLGCSVALAAGILLGRLRAAAANASPGAPRRILTSVLGMASSLPFCLGLLIMVPSMIPSRQARMAQERDHTCATAAFWPGVAYPTSHRAGKGQELYLFLDGSERRYALLPGANWSKFRDEIMLAGVARDRFYSELAGLVLEGNALFITTSGTDLDEKDVEQLTRWAQKTRSSVSVLQCRVDGLGVPRSGEREGGP